MTGSSRSEPVRILFVTADLRTGGAERHIVSLMPALDSDGFAPEVCCIQRKGPLFAELERLGVPARSLDEGGQRRRLLLAAIRLARHMRRVRPHVVMASGFSAGLLTRVAALGAGKPPVVIWKHNSGHLGRHGLQDRVAECLFGRFAARYFGVSYGQLEYLLGYLRLRPSKVRVIRNGVNPGGYAASEAVAALTRDQLGLSPSDFVVGIVAVLRAEKDHVNAVQAIRLLGAGDPAVKLLLVGDGPERVKLSGLVARWGLESQVVFAGHRDDVTSLLQAVDVTVLTSYTVENFPFSVLEAMALEKPVVATAVGGLPEMIEDGVTGYLVTPRDPRALAEKLALVRRSADRGRAMGRAGRQRVEAHFTVATSARRTRDEISQLLEPSLDTGGAR